MGSRFCDLLTIVCNGVAFLIELPEWARTFLGFWS